MGSRHARIYIGVGDIFPPRFFLTIPAWLSWSADPGGIRLEPLRGCRTDEGTTPFSLPRFELRSC